MILLILAFNIAKIREIKQKWESDYPIKHVLLTTNSKYFGWATNVIDSGFPF